jgi:hypothetical protein
MAAMDQARTTTRIHFVRQGHAFRDQDMAVHDTQHHGAED